MTGPVGRIRDAEIRLSEIEASLLRRALDATEFPRPLERTVHAELPVEEIFERDGLTLMRQAAQMRREAAFASSAASSCRVIAADCAEIAPQSQLAQRALQMADQLEALAQGFESSAVLLDQTVRAASAAGELAHSHLVGVDVAGSEVRPRLGAALSGTCEINRLRREASEQRRKARS